MAEQRWTALQLEEQRNANDMLNMKGKVALITGGSGGIGRASALALAQLGADVILTGTSRSVEKLKNYVKYIKDTCGVRAWYYICDVSKDDDIKGLYSFIRSEVGDLHVCFANAGYFSRVDSCQQDAGSFRDMMEIDVVGAFQTAREAAEFMREKGHGGSIIFNASMTAHIINRIQPDEHAKCSYPAAKGAVLHMAKAFALEYAKDGIRSNSVSPGYILSGIHDGRTQEYFDWTANNIPMGRYGTLDEIVGAVIYYASDLSVYTTGSDLLVDGGYCVW